MPTNYPELTTASGTLADSTAGQVAALTELKRPIGSAGAQAQAVLAAMAQTGRAAQGLEDSAAPKNDVATANSTKELTRAFSEASSQAEAFGFSACAVGMRSGMNAVTGGSPTVVKSTLVARADALGRATSRRWMPSSPATKTCRS